MLSSSQHRAVGNLHRFDSRYIPVHLILLFQSPPSLIQHADTQHLANHLPGATLDLPAGLGPHLR